MAWLCLLGQGRPPLLPLLLRPSWWRRGQGRREEERGEEEGGRVVLTPAPGRTSGPRLLGAIQGPAWEEGGGPPRPCGLCLNSRLCLARLPCSCLVAACVTKRPGCGRVYLREEQASSLPRGGRGPLLRRGPIEGRRGEERRGLASPGPHLLLAPPTRPGVARVAPLGAALLSWCWPPGRSGGGGLSRERRAPGGVATLGHGTEGLLAQW